MMTVDYSKNSPGNKDCLAKAEDGEPMFIILGRDPDAANMVRLWARRRLEAGGDEYHCEEALNIADAMDRWASNHKPRTAPDKGDYQLTSLMQGDRP